MNWKFILLVILAFGLIITQFFVDKSNVSSYKSVENFEKLEHVHSNLSVILKNNCYDCHSNHTEYPWYGSIGLVNLVLNYHINKGKKHLNFSDWENYSEKKKLHKLEEIYEEVEQNKMPLNLYKLIHGNLNIETEQAIFNWAEVQIRD